MKVGTACVLVTVCGLAGAAVGGVAGRRGSKRGKQAAEAETTNTYQRAFAACMAGCGYSVK